MTNVANKQIGYETMAVIFIDILGTKNNTGFDHKYAIHRIFHGEARLNERRREIHSNFDRYVWDFSDCAYFIYKRKQGCKLPDMRMLEIAMYNTSLSVLRIINEGYLVRGGIAVGDAFVDELGFFGPAIEEAYLNESDKKRNRMPLILLDDKLGEDFQAYVKSARDPGNDPDNIIKQQLIEEMYSHDIPNLVEYEDGKYFLNIFYHMEGFGPILNMENVSLSLAQIKENFAKAYDDNVRVDTEQGVQNKWNWMKEYLARKHNRLNPNVVSGTFSSIL